METRERILTAARQVMISRGLVGATTKEIARAAGVSEGTLYNHLRNKEELFLCTLRELPAGFISLIVGLPSRAGSDTVRSVLTEVAHAALAFYDESVPMGGSIFADPELMARHRQLLKERGAGPQRANELLAAYLRAEQQAGRVRDEADTEAAAYLLLGAVFQRAYWRQFLGEPADAAADERFLAGVLASLDQILSPEHDAPGSR
jgi:AcrR family transcriptional regulator